MVQRWGDPRSDRIDLRRSLDERCKVRARYGWPVLPSTVQSMWPYQTYPDRPELEFGSVRAQGSLGYDLVTVGAASGARETAGDRLAVTGQKLAQDHSKTRS
ncbi:hypothetical protein F2Q70_00044396 [Brassica cretica]|uniref:Uncharacterized protein n=2 Tax=Brassica cretica TaxID=69181 RepID=A0A8S9KM44_BRACR|nr:hypothetical protein F2Q70_00044396 [Brassica cretica]KAF2606190.1 hypothetical protein F2Q68_00045348 [Brassica cretica]